MLIQSEHTREQQEIANHIPIGTLRLRSVASYRETCNAKLASHLNLQPCSDMELAQRQLTMQVAPEADGSESTPQGAP